MVWLRAFLLLLFFSLLDLCWLNVSQPINHRFGDLVLRQVALSRVPDPNIVVIDIDQKSLEQLQDEAGSWPWPRSVHAELLDGLMQQKPRAVIFDMFFNERDVFRPDSDLAFNDALARYNNVYVGMRRLEDGTPHDLKSLPPALGIVSDFKSPSVQKAGLLLPLALRPENWRAGLIDFLADSDGVGRSYWVFQSISDWRIPSLPARVVGPLKPLPSTRSVMLNWRNQTPYRHVSYADLYQDIGREHPLRPANEFTDKILIVGTAAPGLWDFRNTPLKSQYPGVDILATAIDNLQQGDWLRPLNFYWSLLLLGSGLLLLTWRFAVGASAWASGVVLLLLTLGGSLTTYGLLLLQLWLPLFPVLAWLWLAYGLYTLMAWQQEHKSQQQMVAMFNRVLDPRVVNELVKRGEISQEAKSCEITVLFSDIRGFTTLSETRSPEAVVSLLNRYFNTQVEIVFKHGGTLDKVIGDAIMALGGAALAQEEQAQRAVMAAIEMSAALEKFKQEVAAEGVDFDIGIGLHTGPAVVGFIGSDQRLDYTTIGDAVNLASRIEGQTKGISRVLISQSTKEACGVMFNYVNHGEFKVKGREQAVYLYEPILKG